MTPLPNRVARSVGAMRVSHGVCSFQHTDLAARRPLQDFCLLNLAPQGPRLTWSMRRWITCARMARVSPHPLVLPGYHTTWCLSFAAPPPQSPHPVDSLVSYHLEVPLPPNHPGVVPASCHPEILLMPHRPPLLPLHQAPFLAAVVSSVLESVIALCNQGRTTTHLVTRPAAGPNRTNARRWRRCHITA
jgi:hypothetical protein